MCQIMKDYDGQTHPPFKKMPVDDLQYIKAKLINRKTRIDERLVHIDRVITQKQFERNLNDITK